MSEKSVLVTGAGRGLGLAIARRLAKEGYRVACVSRKLSAELAALKKDHPSVSFYPYDLSDLSGIYRLFKEITSKEGKVYGLVNNAALGYDGVLATMHESQIVELINVNLTSTILLTKYASRSMLLLGSGRIVNISSIIAQTGFNGLSVYAASKAALIGFTRSLSRELGKAGISVNVVAPGYMETDMTKALSSDKLEMIRRRTPRGRLAGVDEVAGAVAFLLGPDAEAINGITLTVDAGSSA